MATQSATRTGTPAAWDAFRALRWNSYAHGFDPGEWPLTAGEDAALMRDAGFPSADAVWSFAGHYLVAGYR